MMEKMEKPLAKFIRCGICRESVPGAIRALNQHKAEKHPEVRARMRASRKTREARRGVSMNYCQDCSKFVSLEPGDPAGDEAYGVRLVLLCGACSMELHEATVAILDELL